MRSLLLLPINRLILNIWLRMTGHIFHRQKKTVRIRTSIIIGSLCAVSLLVYPSLVQVLGVSQYDYTLTTQYPDMLLIIVFSGYMLAVLLLNMVISNKFTETYLWIKQTLIWLMLIIGGYFLLGSLVLAPLVIYFFIVAAAEEGLKYLSSIQLYKKRQFSSTDLILFAMLTALGFAFFENIVYMLQSTHIIDSALYQLTSGTGILIKRGLVGFLVHLLFTGSIAYISILGLSKKYQWGYLIGAFIIGIGLHMSYNLLLSNGLNIFILLYLLAGYILLSWLFYKSDGVYLEGNQNNIKG